MNQQLTIVFIAFLLVTVLLLLLLANGREKSRRTRVLVDLAIAPETDQLRDMLFSCFRQIGREHPFVFLFAGETGPDLLPAPVKSLRLSIGFADHQGDHFLIQQAPSGIFLIVGPQFTPKDNSDFIQEISSTLLAAAGS